MQQTRRTRVTANLVGGMLFVQVILGGSAVVLGVEVIYPLVWGTLTFIILILTTVLAARSFGTGSTLLKVGLVDKASTTIALQAKRAALRGYARVS